jgi:hypothetical protein
MHIIKSIHRAVADALKRVPGGALGMDEIEPIKALCELVLPNHGIFVPFMSFI